MLVLGFILDRVLKFVFNQKLPHEEFFIIPKFISLRLHQNTGMAFSLEVPQAILIYLGGAILLILAFAGIYGLLRQQLDWLNPIGLLFAGGASNLFDRIAYGYTIDYIYLRPYSLFNLADIMIVAGCLLALLSLREKKPYRDKK